MNRDSLSIGLVVVCLLVVSGTSLWAQGSSDSAPPFRSGEVAVYGSPDELADYDVVKYLPHSGISVVRVESGREWGQVQRLRAQGKRAGLNFIAEAFEVPNDPYYNPYQWHFPAIQSEAAWDLTAGTGAVVAVTDSGLAPGGADGINCVVDGYDAVNGDNDPFDGDGHGTHVSGTIAQSTNNNIAGAGMAYGACVMPVKVLNDSGSGSFADIAEGIYYAVNNDGDVINMSLGVAARYQIYSDPIVDPALDYAYDNGVTVVCASGNDGSRRNVGYPASYTTTIAVGATDYLNNVTRYSNKGTGLDIVAPGGDTSVDRNGDGYVDGVLQETLIDGAWGYYFFQGTSMASPHVAAVAAMLYSHVPGITPAGVYDALTATALDIEDAGYDSASAHGLVQAYDALVYATGGTICTNVDDDGWCVEDGDCNDSDPTVNPGAAEICDDGIDNNCDGSIDEGCDPVCTDVDNDLWCAEDGDCDDSDPAVNPDAAEVCDDGIDNNCDGTVDEGCGACTDSDADGWCVEDGDCDDTNPQVNPGMNERGKRRNDGLDNDCNGVIDG